MGKKLTIYDPQKGRYVLVGEIVGKHFIREVKKEHFVFKYKGYGLQTEVFSEFDEVDTIILKSDGFIWKSKKSDWDEYGITDDLGHGAQRFLATKYMERVDPKQPKLL